MILFEVDGKRFSGFDEITVEKSIDSISGKFNITTPGNVANDFLRGIQKARVKMIIEDKQVLDGFVDIIQIDYSRAESAIHTLRISGRDKTSDVVDSTFGKNLNFSGVKKLEDIIKQTLSAHKITGIEVVNEVEDLADFEEFEISTPIPGDRLFPFLESLAKRKQVLLTSDGKGNIVISRSTGIVVQEKLVNLSENKTGNIKGANMTFNFASRFNRYKVLSQESPEKINISASLNSAKRIENSGNITSIDSEIRESRSLTFVEKESHSPKQARDRADWTNNFKQIESIGYNITVAGHRRSPGEDIWEPGQLVIVEDDFTETEAQLLINRVTYNEAISGGETCQLELVRKDAYQVKVEEPTQDKNSNKLGKIVL